MTGLPSSPMTLSPSTFRIPIAIAEDTVKEVFVCNYVRERATKEVKEREKYT